MVKDRNRFDALAEEMFGEPEPPRKTLTKEAKARLDKIVDEYKPPAITKTIAARRPKDRTDVYISFKGVMYLARSLSVRMKDSEMYGGAAFLPTARRAGLSEISFELPGTSLRLLGEDDVVLVVTRGDVYDESEFFRLDVHDCTYHVINSGSSYTEVHARGWRMQ